MSRIPLLSRTGDIVNWALNITQRIERDYAELKLIASDAATNLLSASAVIKTDISSVSAVIETRIDSLSAALSLNTPVAWARFDGTTPPYSPSGNNVSSVTRSGTGAYWVYILSPLQPNTIAVYGNCTSGVVSVADCSTTSVKVVTLDFSGTAVDSSYVSVMVLGSP